MKDKELTPEEKLLNLIRHGGKKRPEPEQQASAANPEKTADEVTPKEAAKGRWFRSLQGLGRLSTIETLWATNRILIVLFIVLFGIFIYGFVVRPVRELPKVRPRRVEGKVEPLAQKVRPYVYYEDIGKRELFRPITYRTIKGIEKPDIKKLAKELELIGIVGGEKPVAIIEDKRKRKSYFLNEGEEIKGLTVKEIYEDKVILTHDDQRIELLL